MQPIDKAGRIEPAHVGDRTAAAADLTVAVGIEGHSSAAAGNAGNRSIFGHVSVPKILDVVLRCHRGDRVEKPYVLFDSDLVFPDFEFIGDRAVGFSLIIGKG